MTISYDVGKAVVPEGTAVFSFAFLLTRTACTLYDVVI